MTAQCPIAKHMRRSETPCSRQRRPAESDDEAQLASPGKAQRTEPPAGAGGEAAATAGSPDTLRPRSLAAEPLVPGGPLHADGQHKADVAIAGVPAAAAGLAVAADEGGAAPVEPAAEVAPADQAADAYANPAQPLERPAPQFPSGAVLSKDGKLGLKEILTREIAFLGVLSKAQPFDAHVTKLVLQKVRFGPT